MENNPFINELNKFSLYEDKPNKNNKECIDDLIKNMETDQGLLNIIKNYQDYEDQKRARIESEAEENENENSNLFSNYLIQSSFTKFNNLKRIVVRKENLLLIHYLDKWKIRAMQKQNPQNPQNSNFSNNYVNPLFVPSKQVNEIDYLAKNRKIIETYLDDSGSISDFDYLNVNTNQSQGHNYDLPLQSPKKNPANSLVDNSKAKNPKILMARVIKNIFQNKLKYYFSLTISKTEGYINSKKLANSSLSLLYMFTELAISKNKVNKGGFSVVDKSSNSNLNNSNDEMKLKLNEYEKKISKYEASLNEKAEIIAGRNDRIEQQIETIELLTEEINRLNLKTEKLEKKCKNLNVINGINIFYFYFRKFM
jgi:hypothetical protein